MSENNHLTPLCIIYADGKRLDADHEGALRRITVTDRLNGISTAAVLFSTVETKVRDLGLIALESTFSIHLGYKDDLGAVFQGEVTGFRETLPPNGAEELEVSGCNVLHKLSHASRFHNFEGKTPSEVISGILDGYSLQAEAEDFGANQDFSSEKSQTDLEYLLLTALSYGKQVYADGSTVYIKNETAVRSDEIIYEWGKTLIHFEGTQNILQLNSAVDFIGWDHLKGESFAGCAELSDIPVKIGGSNDWTKISKGGNGKYREIYINSQLKDMEEANALASGILQQNSFAFCHAEGRGEGNYKLRPGMRVTIKMTGETFAGEYMADTVTHSFDSCNGYTTSFTLKRNMLP